MNKKNISIALASAAALSLPFLAFAQAPVNQIGSLDQLVDVIVNFIWIVFGVIVVIAFVIAGVLFLTAAGNPEKVAQARTAFLWGVAGVVVGILAFSILKIIQTAIT